MKISIAAILPFVMLAAASQAGKPLKDPKPLPGQIFSDDVTAPAAEDPTPTIPSLVEYTTSDCSITNAITSVVPSVWYTSTCVWTSYTATVNSVDYEYGCSTYVATSTASSMD